MKKWPIEKLRELYSYDPETGHIFQRHSDRNGFDTSKPVGSKYRGYIRINNIAAHQLAWALHYGKWPRMVDHIDRDRSNNRITNLRLATNGQNQANRAMCGEIPAKGVCMNSRRTKYAAQIQVNGRPKFLGHFDTVDEAAHAYNKAAIQYHSEFALLNPIGEDKHV